MGIHTRKLYCRAYRTRDAVSPANTRGLLVASQFCGQQSPCVDCGETTAHVCLGYAGTGVVCAGGPAVDSARKYFSCFQSSQFPNLHATAGTTAHERPDKLGGCRTLLSEGKVERP